MYFSKLFDTGTSVHSLYVQGGQIGIAFDHVSDTDHDMTFGKSVGGKLFVSNYYLSALLKLNKSNFICAFSILTNVFHNLFTTHVIYFIFSKTLLSFWKNTFIDLDK